MKKINKRKFIKGVLISIIFVVFFVSINKVRADDPIFWWFQLQDGSNTVIGTGGLTTESGFTSITDCNNAKTLYIADSSHMASQPGTCFQATRAEIEANKTTPHKFTGGIATYIYYYEYGMKLGDGTYSTSQEGNYATIEECEVARKKVEDNPKFDVFYSKISPTCLRKDKNVVYVDGQNSVEVNKDVYNFLAPIGTLKCMNTNGTDGCVKSDIGTYLNIIFKLGIGIAAALAVIMLIINGITYMGDESIFSKTEAKKKMFSAVLGLFIALGAWALLNTINPDLTGKNGVTIDGVKVELEPLYERGASDPKNVNGESVRCTPVLSGPCSVANLTPIFGAENAIAMSKICNMESSGIENISSGTDYCSPPGKSLPFSFGLFQVNLSSNGSLASTTGLDCSNLFDRAVRGKDAIEPKYNNGFTCSLLPGKDPVYQACKNRLLNTATNLEIAKKLYTPDKKAWVGDKKYCSSAFQ